MNDNRRFARVEELFGREGFARIRASTVMVAGLGGVGCHASIALARSGIGRLILVDFDLITETSLNRNPVARLSDCGKPKALVLAEAIGESCPDTETRGIVEFFHTETADTLLAGRPDAVLDAIDSLNPKTALIQECISRGIPVYSSMGASGRRDPSMLRTGDISQTRGCPLARQVRKYLRKRGIDEGVRCVYSVEPAGDHWLPPDHDDTTLKRGRTRNRIPSSIIMPGIFGYALAGMVLDSLATGH